MLASPVIVSAFRSRRGASNRVLVLVASGRVVPLATPALFLGDEAVPKRPAQLAASGFSGAEMDATLAALAAALEAVEVRFAWRPQLPEPDDEMVLEAAVNGRADALVTHNLADFTAAAPRPGLPLLRPAELLERINA